VRTMAIRWWSWVHSSREAETALSTAAHAAVDRTVRKKALWNLHSGPIHGRTIAKQRRKMG